MEATRGSHVWRESEVKITWFRCSQKALGTDFRYSATTFDVFFYQGPECAGSGKTGVVGCSETGLVTVS